jgi:hypothetical protein
MRLYAVVDDDDPGVAVPPKGDSDRFCPCFRERGLRASIYRAAN